jgi:PAS domain S-box-containing protein
MNQLNATTILTSKTKPNILIVDDDISAVKYIEVILKHLNINIITATSAGEALGKIKGKEIALALLDIMMPEIGGIELATILKDETTREFFPIIFISGFSKDEYEVERYYSTGSIDFILKPFNKNILIKKVAILLEMHQQKQQIKESEALYRAILDASPDSIIVMDRELNVIDVSSQVPKMCGQTDKLTILGNHFEKICVVDDHQKLLALIQKTIDTTTSQMTHFKIFNEESSEYISCEISTSLILDEEEEPKSIMLIIRDITSRELMEQQLIQQERMAVLGEMATGIAHEINQPMNIISMSMENLLMELKSEKEISKKYIEGKSDKIFENILRIRNIIDHIRNFSRDQQDYFAIQFDVNESIRNAISMIDQQLKNEQIQLTTNLSKEVPLINGNTYKFEQVILNLMGNARDALKEKENHEKMESVTKTIAITTRMEQDQVLVSVTDNGIGIKKEKIRQILKPFYTTKEEGKGTGIGLSISQGIVRELHGFIDVESEYEKGTTINLHIPVSVSEPKETKKG